MIRLDRFIFRTLLGTISIYGLVSNSSPVLAWDLWAHVSKNDLIPILGDAESYWRNDAGLITSEDVINRKNSSSWCALSCRSGSCILYPVSPQFEQGVPISKPGDVFYFTQRKGIGCEGDAKTTYRNPEARPFYTDGYRTGNYIDGTAYAANRQPLPNPIRIEELVLSAIPDGGTTNFVISFGDKNQIVEVLKPDERGFFTVLWAGDLNRDGRTDLLYRYMLDYGDGIHGTIKLMLSSKADTELLKQIGAYAYYNGG